jgi:hypothetical protein
MQQPLPKLIAQHLNKALSMGIACQIILSNNPADCFSIVAKGFEIQRIFSIFDTPEIRPRISSDDSERILYWPNITINDMYPYFNDKLKFPYLENHHCLEK